MTTAMDDALRIVCEVALEWAGEYGFTFPERATEVSNAAKLLRSSGASDPRGGWLLHGILHSTEDPDGPHVHTIVPPVLTVTVDGAEIDGGFVVSAAEAPGCVSQGETTADALKHFADAYAAWTQSKRTWHSDIMQAGMTGLRRADGWDDEDHSDCQNIVFAVLTGLADAGYRLVKP